uniref:Uncharacterized protein n=1 Tax=Arundo donax TaxID=35708 RepID=A0A0A8XSN6_ARUDO
MLHLLSHCYRIRIFVFYCGPYGRSCLSAILEP